jgi:hypothetical protein
MRIPCTETLLERAARLHDEKRRATLAHARWLLSTPYAEVFAVLEATGTPAFGGLLHFGQTAWLTLLDHTNDHAGAAARLVLTNDILAIFTRPATKRVQHWCRKRRPTHGKHWVSGPQCVTVGWKVADTSRQREKK